MTINRIRVQHIKPVDSVIRECNHPYAEECRRIQSEWQQQTAYVLRQGPNATDSGAMKFFRSSSESVTVAKQMGC